MGERKPSFIYNYVVRHEIILLNTQPCGGPDNACYTRSKYDPLIPHQKIQTRANISDNNGQIPTLSHKPSKSWSLFPSLYISSEDMRTFLTGEKACACSDYYEEIRRCVYIHSSKSKYGVVWKEIIPLPAHALWPLQG